jgi:hypothetical protein
VEDRLGLTSVSGLLTIVTTLSLGEQGSLSSLVLGNLVLGVLLAGLTLAEGLAGLGNVDLKSKTRSAAERYWRFGTSPIYILLFRFAGYGIGSLGGRHVKTRGEAAVQWGVPR